MNAAATDQQERAEIRETIEGALNAVVGMSAAEKSRVLADLDAAAPAAEMADQRLASLIGGALVRDGWCLSEAAELTTTALDLRPLA